MHQPSSTHQTISNSNKQYKVVSCEQLHGYETSWLKHAGGVEYIFLKICECILCMYMYVEISVIYVYIFIYIYEYI